VSDTYEIELFVQPKRGTYFWELVLTTTGFVEALSRFLDERKAAHVVRMGVR